MKIAKSIFFICCVWFSNLQSQNSVFIDSLKIELHNSSNLSQQRVLLNSLSNAYFQSEQYFDAIPFKQRELKLSLNLKDDSASGYCNERLGMMYYRIGNYDVSSRYFLKALHYFEHQNDLEMKAQITGNLANVYTRIENYKSALKYLFISKNILTQKKRYNKKTIAGLFINIGLAYEGNEQLDSAMFYYNEAVELISDFEKANPLYLATVLNNIGEVDFALNHYENALKNYNESLKLFTKISNKNGMGSALSNIAKVKIKTGNYKKAIPLCNKALTYFKNINSLYFIVVTQKQLSEAYEGTGNYKKSIYYLKEYVKSNDSLKGHETVENIANREMEYAMNKEQQKFLSGSFHNFIYMIK